MLLYAFSFRFVSLHRFVSYRFVEIVSFRFVSVVSFRFHGFRVIVNEYGHVPFVPVSKTSLRVPHGTRANLEQLRG